MIKNHDGKPSARTRTASRSSRRTRARPPAATIDPQRGDGAVHQRRRSSSSAWTSASTRCRRSPKSTGHPRGLASTRATTPSFSLGTSTPSAIRMADAYATFAASGTHARAVLGDRGRRQDGETLSGFEPPKDQAGHGRDVADNVTDVLENVVENGTGTKAQAAGPARGRQDRYHRRATSPPGSSATPRSCPPSVTHVPHGPEPTDKKLHLHVRHGRRRRPSTVVTFPAADLDRLHGAGAQGRPAGAASRTPRTSVRSSTTPRARA